MLGLNEVMTKEEAKRLGGVILAFVGDAVYSLYVRKKLVFSGDGKAADYQRTSSKIVCAGAQSAFLEKILPTFTDEEQEVYHRARNAKKGTKSKSASVADYNRSTGVEAVVGYLYLIGDTKRLDELFSQLDEQAFSVEKTAQKLKP